MASITTLLGELQATFPAGQTTGTFDATQVLGGEYTALLSGLGVPNPLALSSPAGWQNDGTNLTLAGTSADPLLGMSGPAVYFRFAPAGSDWVLLLDITLPGTWTFSQSFPLLAQGVFAELTLDASPAALLVASAPTTDPQRQANGAALTLSAGLNFYGTFATNSSALAQVAWLLDGGTAALTTGPITFNAANGAVAMQLPLATAMLNNLFGDSGPQLVFTVSLYSGLNVALNQYENGVCFEASIKFGSSGDVNLSALLSSSTQAVLELSLTGSALAFPDEATLAQFFGQKNGITAALPDFGSGAQPVTDLVQVQAIVFGIGLQSKSLEYAFLSVGALTGQTWQIIPNLVKLGNLDFLFCIFQPFGTTPTWSFSFTAVFTLANVSILVQAQLPGETLSGQLDPAQDDPLLSTLVQQVFGFTNGLPTDLTISALNFSADVPNKQYSAELDIEGEWSFDFGDDNQIVFEELRLGFTYDSAGATGTLQAKFAIDADNQFDVELDMSAANTLFVGSWVDSGTPLTFQDLAVALGMYGVPNLPDHLNLGLTAATFEFESAEPSFAFAIETELYTGADPTQGNPASAALVAGKNATKTNWGYLYGMVVGLDLQVDLTNIPLVGDLVPAGDDVLALTSLRLLAATSTLPVYASAPLLDAVFGTAVNSGLVLSVDLQIGNSQTETFTVRFGGTNDGTANDQPAGKAPQALLAAGPPAPLAAGAAPTTAQPGQQATWVNVQRAFGPVQINRVGFAITPSSEVSLLLDAGVALGGLSIGLTGLGATMPLQWPPAVPSFELAGLQVQYTAAAFSIGGGLATVPGASPAEYTGELMLTLGSFGATALGSYTTANGQPSLFAFVFIDAPLGGPPAFFVTGLAGGFGYNRSLQLPAVADVGTYPLVQGAMGTLDAKKTQTQLQQYIQPQPNENWFAAGVRFTSFEMVKSFALLTVSFGTNVEIALMGESTLTVPVSTLENPQNPVAEADLLLLVDVQVTNGVVAVSAQLSPLSYVFSTAARLTGGFAFYLWFGRSPYAGDFVVTLGGYNPYFQPPTYYPSVPQLGLNWQVSDLLVVKGGLYFALTPAVIMAGGMLSATWQSGNVKAWFNAQADFLIRFKPFAYLINISVSIGLSVKVDLLITSFTVSVQVGVGLTLWGPPFGGTARIDLRIVSVTLSFGGGSPAGNSSIGWSEFQDSFLPNSSAGASALPTAANVDVALAADAAPATTATTSLITLNAPTGIVSTFTQGTATVWAVNAGVLQLVIATQIPSTTVTVLPTTTVQTATAWTTSLGVGPMGAGPGTLASELTILINREGATDSDDWSASAVLGSVPAGLWQNTSSASSTMQGSSTVADALLGIVLTPTPPSGASTLPVPIAELLSDEAPVRPYAWSTATVPQGDSFDQHTAMTQLQSSLTDATVATSRSNILAALAAQGLTTATQVSVGNFAQQAPDLLAAPPALRSLGEVPA
jgi:hypothetical protein